MMGKPPPGQTAGRAPSPAQGKGTSPSGSAQGVGGVQGMPPGAQDEEVKLSDVRWGLIFRMGWKMVAFCKHLALIYCLMMLLQNGMNLGMSQLVGNITQELTRPAEVVMPGDSSLAATSPDVAPSSPPAPPATDHTRLIWICILWAICALGALSLGIPFRAISTKLDLTISNRLRSQLFERLLRQGPEFYHTHDPGELNAVANQFTIEAAMTMRQVAVDMLLQMAILGGTVALLIYNFQMKGPPPTILGYEIGRAHV